MAVTKQMTFVYDGDPEHAHDWVDRKCEECGAEGRIYEISDITLNHIQRMMGSATAEYLTTPVVEEHVRGSKGYDLQRCAIAVSILHQDWGIVDVRIGNDIVVLLKDDGTGLRGVLHNRDRKRLDLFDDTARHSDGAVLIWPEAGVDVRILPPPPSARLGARSDRTQQGTETRTGRQKNYRTRSAPTRPIFKEDLVDA